VGDFLQVDRRWQEHEKARFNRPATSGIVNDRGTTMEATTILISALALLILLAVTSIRFGVESREGFSTKEPGQASRGPNSVAKQ